MIANLNKSGVSQSIRPSVRPVVCQIETTTITLESDDVQITFGIPTKMYQIQFE